MAFYGRRNYRGYANMNVQSNVADRVTDPAVGGRLTTLLANTALTQKDREFVTSLDSTWKRFNNMSANQYKYFEIVENRYDPAAIAANASSRAAWVASWDKWKQKQFELCCKYYSTTEYFRDLAAKGLTDKNFIPTEKQFRAMCENKYAQRLVHNMTHNSFDINDTVEMRRRHGETREVGVVVGVEDTITRASARVGGRIYRVMWMTSGEETRVLEADLKTYRHKE